MRSIAHTFASASAALILSAGLAGPAAAQNPDVPRNVRVRLTLAGDRAQHVVGVVVPDGGDSLMVRTRDSLAVIPRERVQRVELSGRGGRRIRTGMLIGFAAGAVVGGVAGLTCPEDCQPGMSLILGGGGGGVGAILGGAIGALVRSERWMDVNQARSAIAVGSARDGGGMALGISLTTR
ncbi:MAG TPA: hypothetical protein VFS20_03130 [Longimicrobium sp.]|nr:hypothetical protein [Longimicrobium sp.]